MAVIKSALFLLIFFISPALHASVSGSDSHPIVYTGITTYPHDDGDQIRLITRLHLVKVGVNNFGGVNYKAIVIHHLADDASNEYVSYDYDVVSIDPVDRRMVLSPPNSGDAPVTSPEFSLKFDESFSDAEGTITNRFLSEKSGSVTLRAGWDFDRSVKVESRYGGLYSISCREAPRAAMSQAKSMLIVPTPLPSVVMEMNNSLDYDLTYQAGITSGYGASVGLQSVAAHLNFGRGKFLSRRLTFLEGRNEWNCSRIDQKRLQCRSSYHGGCELEKADETHISTAERSPMKFARIDPAKTDPQVMHPGDCSGWNKSFHGYLRHRIGGKLQPLKIDMRTISRMDLSGQHVCELDVRARLSFFPHFKDSFSVMDLVDGVLVYPFGRIRLDPGASRVVLTSSNPSEITLVAHRDERGSYSFDWISNRFGHVGDVLVSADRGDPELPDPAKSSLVSGVADLFYSAVDDQPQFFMSMKFSPRLSSRFAAEKNPFARADVNGWVIQGYQGMAMEDSPRFAIRPDVNFDFYTNYFTLSDGNLMAGQTTDKGLQTRSIHSGVMSLTRPDFPIRRWSRITESVDVSRNVVASLQGGEKQSSSASTSAIKEKALDLVIASQDTSIRSVMVAQDGTLMSTKDWGSVGGWNRVLSMRVGDSWRSRRFVRLVVVFTDGRHEVGLVPLMEQAEKASTNKN